MNLNLSDGAQTGNTAQPRFLFSRTDEQWLNTLNGTARKPLNGVHQ